MFWPVKVMILSALIIPFISNICYKLVESVDNHCIMELSVARNFHFIFTRQGESQRPPVSPGGAD